MGRHSAAWAGRIAVKRQGSNVLVLGLPRNWDETPLKKYLQEEWLPAVRLEVEPSTYMGARGVLVARSPPHPRR
jgi:hypothetical protein